MLDYFIIKKDNETVKIFGPCRYLINREVKEIVEYLISEAHKYAPCSIKFLDKYINVHNPEETLYHNPENFASEEILEYFLNRQSNNIGSWIYWSGVSIQKEGENIIHKYEFDDIPEIGNWSFYD